MADRVVHNSSHFHLTSNVLLFGSCLKSKMHSLWVKSAVFFRIIKHCVKAINLCHKPTFTLKTPRSLIVQTSWFHPPRGRCDEEQLPRRDPRMPLPSVCATASTVSHKYQPMWPDRLPLKPRGHSGDHQEDRV